jgi:hypothetical protein
MSAILPPSNAGSNHFERLPPLFLDYLLSRKYNFTKSISGVILKGAKK